MKTPGLITNFLLFLSLFSGDAFAEDCGPIIVDCREGRISMSGLPAKGSCGEPDRIDCGLPTRNSPPGYPGRIGGRHKGPVVPNGIRIEGINGMGDSGGGKVFHTSNVWNDNSCPKLKTWGQGCITVGPEVIRRLRQCKGSQLIIKNARGGTVSRGYADKNRQELISQRNNRNTYSAPKTIPEVKSQPKVEIRAEIEKPKSKWSGRAYDPEAGFSKAASGSF